MNNRILIALSIAAFCTQLSVGHASEDRGYSADAGASQKLAACYPQLAKLQAHDEIPFPQVSEQTMRSVMGSGRISLVLFPFDPEIFAPNRYAIYSAPCASEALGMCHYLKVEPTMGLPRNHLYGPLNLSCAPGRYDPSIPEWVSVTGR